MLNTPSSRHPTMVEKGRLKRIAGGCRRIDGGGKYYLAATVDCLDAASSAPKPEATYANDAYKVFVGGHYNFDVFRRFGTVQYLKNMPWIGGYSTKEIAPLALGSKGPQKGFEAWAFSTGVDFRAVGGKVMTSVGYAAAKIKIWKARTN